MLPLLLRVEARRVKVWDSNRKGVARPEGDEIRAGRNRRGGRGGFATPIVREAVMVNRQCPLVAAG